MKKESNNKMQDIYEKLGLFYLGEQENKDLTLYKSKDLTTHAMIIGMTGSGKTGLGIGLLEEAALDNIPAIVIDPKGDMGNLLLTFPNLTPKEFAPWVQADQDPNTIAALWKDGLKKSYQDTQRLAQFANVEKTIYTPGSSSGIGVNILGSFQAPPQEICDDKDLIATLINTTVSSLLTLLDIDADPLQSPEHLLLSNILYHFYMQGISLSIEELIGYITTPPFQKVGLFPLKTFYPQKERMKLAFALNGLISSISFNSWIEGEALDIQKMLYNDAGEAKIAIFNIAHLNENERMFFVTLLLNAYIAWMRQQRGSNTLKSVLYMDEIFGFFPPLSNPPSKKPMLLLLKQARAFGTGIILSTQNPVDIDYKALGNIGTWCVGKLQTQQDIQRVAKPLATQSKQSLHAIEEALSNLKTREFFLKNIHTATTIRFTTRWCLSYLKGPITKNDIRQLMQDKKNKYNNNSHIKIEQTLQQPHTTLQYKKQKPLITYPIDQFYSPSEMAPTHPYHPSLYVIANVRFFNQKRGIDEIQNFHINLDDFSTNQFQWDKGYNEKLSSLTKQEPATASYTPLPSILEQLSSIKTINKSVANYLYTSQKKELYKQKKLKLESKLHQNKRDFIVDITNRLRELRDETVEKIEQKYSKKFITLEKKKETLQKKLQKEQHDLQSQTSDTLIDVGVALFDAFFGKRKTSSIRKGVSAFKKGRGILKEKEDVATVETMLENLEIQYDLLEQEIEEKIKTIHETYKIENYPIESFYIKPRRNDIEIKQIALVWRL